MRFVNRYGGRRRLRGMGAEVAVDFDAGTVGGQPVPGIKPLYQPAADPEGDAIRSLVAAGDMTVAQAAQAGVIINQPGATNSWDAASNAFGNMIKSATQGYTLYKTITTPKPAPVPTVMQSQTGTSRLLLYGGLAVAALAVLMVMRKQ
jgi:hypothetical protein